jgi:hypothetical protein
MTTVSGWLRASHLKLIIVTGVSIAALGGTALAAGALGSAAKKKCNQTCRETKLFNTLYDAKIATAHVAFAATAGSATTAASASSADSAATTGAITGVISGSQVSGTVANATNAASAANATNATDATNATNATDAANATNATNAANAANATDATNATNVDGHQFAQISASAGAEESAKLLNDFGGLTLECVGPSGGAGSVTLAVVNSSQASGTFGAGEVDGSGAAHFGEAPVAAATGGTPQITDFPFPVQNGAEVNFSFKLSVDNATDVVSGTFTIVLDNGCTAFGNADASSVTQ